MNRLRLYLLSVLDTFDKMRYKKLSDEKVIITAIHPQIVYSIIRYWLKENNDKGWDEDTGIVGRVNRFTGKLTVMYRFHVYEPRAVTNYYSYYIMAKISTIEENHTEITYSFVYDRFVAWTKRILGLGCSIPLAEMLLLMHGNDNIIIFSLIMTGLLALCGILLIFNKEKKGNAAAVIGLFEKDMNAMFSI